MEKALPDLSGRLLLASKLSQSELSRRVDVSRSNITRWLAGDGDITLSVFSRIVRELGIDLVEILDRRLDEILGRKDQPTFDEAIARAVEALPPLDQRVLLTTLLRKIETLDVLEEERSVIKRRISKIRTVRKRNE